MNRTFKILTLFLFIIVLLSIGKSVNANYIEKISMDIYIDSNGNANITEIWDCDTNEGTEVYHPYYNLGTSKIRNLKVADKSQTYETLSSWDTSKTFSDKAYTCGLNYIQNGVEICWGMSSYDSQVYTVSYTITDFVANLTDSQMIYWTLIPYEFSNSIGDAYIKIRTNFDIPDTTDVWGYGNYGGTSYVYDGYIEMQSDGNLSSNEYMTILVKFPKGTFSSSNNLEHDFKYYFNMAEENAVKYKEKDRIVVLTVVSLLLVSFTIIIVIVVIGISNSAERKYEFENKGKKIPEDVPYFRDIPCKNNLFKAYYIAFKYKIIKNKTDILGAIILQWLKDNRIRVEKRKNTSKKEDTIIILNETKPEEFTDYEEKRLFEMLVEASKDGILENNEFKVWCKKSYEKILAWFDKIIRQEEDKLIEEGLIRIEEKNEGIFKSKKYILTENLRNIALEIAGLKKYLLEYSLIGEREALEVHLFEDYLIYAQMMGIAKKVANQFKELYPDMIEKTVYGSYDNVIFINTYSSRGISEARSAKSKAESYTSGGGGYSSGGGGGGSFGGGGGGGGFR